MRLAKAVMDRIFPKPWKPEKVWNLWEQQKGWGWNLLLNERADGNWYVIGHLPSRYEFQDGHELRTRMQSGKVGRWRIHNVDYKMSVDDMLSADLEFVGYVETESASAACDLTKEEK